MKQAVYRATAGGSWLRGKVGRNNPILPTKTMQQPDAPFSELVVKGFRRLLDVRLSLGPLSVMIGANGCGKTSVLDVLALLASSAQARLVSSLSEMSGLASVLTIDRAGELKIAITRGALKYRLILRPQGLSFMIPEELLLPLDNLGENRSGPYHIESHDGAITYFNPLMGLNFAPTWNYASLETALGQVPKNYETCEEFRSSLASIASYRPIQVEPRSPVRLPQQLSPATSPGKNGEDLVSCLFYLRETERDRFDAIEDSLKVAFPKFERLDFPPVAAGTLSLAWRERGFSKPLYSHQLSEGTLRYLWLTTLLQSPGLTALTLLDEPEVSLHPELLSLLADQMREASRRTQLVVATQSDTLIRFLEPSEVLVANSDEDGMTQLTRADELDLDDWLKDYSLDELWRNGRLGGRS